MQKLSNYIKISRPAAVTVINVMSALVCFSTY